MDKRNEEFWDMVLDEECIMFYVDNVTCISLNKGDVVNYRLEVAHWKES